MVDFDFGEYKPTDPLASFDSQPEKKPKKKSKTVKAKAKPKPKPPVALRTCRVLLEGVTIDLVKDQVIEGLTSQELAYLKSIKKVK